MKNKVLTVISKCTLYNTQPLRRPHPCLLDYNRHPNTKWNVDFVYLLNIIYYFNCFCELSKK